MPPLKFAAPATVRFVGPRAAPAGVRNYHHKSSGMGSRTFQFNVIYRKTARRNLSKPKEFHSVPMSGLPGRNF
ncbi:hypothetical protein TNCV_1853551 [Trichonephila clavipes]|nr:hypothetical protein TNCV_1853551 [Trichonephila clavipes]